MSLINCKVHGEIGVIPYVSNDLCQFIAKKNKVESSEIKIIHVIYFDEGEVLFDRFYYVSAVLFDSLKLKFDYEIISDEDELAFNSKIKKILGVICVGCFKDYMNDIGYRYEL